MTREEAIKIIGKDLACYKASDDCGLICSKCNLLTDSKDLMEAYEMAIRDIESMNNITKAVSKMLSDEFVAYVYNEILTIDEEVQNE